MSATTRQWTTHTRFTVCNGFDTRHHHAQDGHAAHTTTYTQRHAHPTPQPYTHRDRVTRYGATLPTAATRVCLHPHRHSIATHPTNPSNVGCCPTAAHAERLWPSGSKGGKEAAVSTVWHGGRQPSHGSTYAIRSRCVGTNDGPIGEPPNPFKPRRRSGRGTPTPTVYGAVTNDGVAVLPIDHPLPS